MSGENLGKSVGRRGEVENKAGDDGGGVREGDRRETVEGRFTGAAKDFDDFYELDGNFGCIHLRWYIWGTSVGNS